MTLNPGDTLGPYVLGAEIGAGGMARVYRGRRPGDAGDVAIKVLRAEFRGADPVVKRFLREARILRGLSHPCLVRVLEVGQQFSPAWFSMEWVEGRSLAEAIEPGKPFGDARALAVFGDVLAGLAHAHKEGVVHRDLKPANVLLTPEGRAKLSDFGIAKLLEGTQLTETGTRLGTPHYMAPEQVRGRRSVGVGADIYSAGVMLYELLTGRRPFDGQDPVAIGYCHAYEDLPPLKRRGKAVPPGLVKIVEKALEKKAGSRWRAARTMRRALSKVADELGHPLPPVPRGKKPAPRPARPAKGARGAAPRREAPSTPGPIALALPGPRHLHAATGAKPLTACLGGLVLVSLGAQWIPGTRPGVEARSPEAVRAARRVFLTGLGAASRGDFSGAIRDWRRAGERDPALLPAIRDHASQACRESLDRGRPKAAAAYLALAHWADPGWEGWLALRARLEAAGR